MTYTLITPKLTWSFTPYYSFTNNDITGTRYTDGQDIVATYANVMKKKKFGFLFLYAMATFHRNEPSFEWFG